jgi:hypothetical protein
MQNVWDIEFGSDQLQGMDKIMEKLDNIGIKLCCCTERTLVVSIFCYSCVCLWRLVPVSMHYRLCL